MSCNVNTCTCNNIVKKQKHVYIFIRNPYIYKKKLLQMAHRMQLNVCNKIGPVTYLCYNVKTGLYVLAALL